MRNSPQNTQKRPSADTEYTESIGKGGSAFSVFSGQKRLARWVGFTTEHTERATPDTEIQRKDVEGCTAFSVFSVRRNAPQKTKFSEERLRINGEAARKGPRGFSVFCGSGLDRAGQGYLQCVQ